MKAAAIGSGTDPVFKARRGMTLLLLILLAVGLCSALHAEARPFWYDEICTVILCRLPSTAELWNALKNAADTNPPVFYVIARFTRQLVSDDYLGYRLPSIVGILSTVSCIYFILLKRVNHLSALLGATLALCTPLADYAYEARPYALMLGCISVAILAWQRIDESRYYVLILAIVLASAASLHYYSVLVWPAFIVAEGSVWIFRRRLRLGVWAALIAGALPLLFFAKLLLKLRQYYGHNFWSQPSFKQISTAYSWLFRLGDHWSGIFAAGLIAVFLYVRLTNKSLFDRSDRRSREEEWVPIEEQALTIMLVCLPIVAVVAAKVSHGGMATRYMLPTVLGGALSLGYLVNKGPDALKTLLLILLLSNFASSSVNTAIHALKGSLLQSRASANRELRTIVGQYYRSDLPIVIASGLQYLPMAYYTPNDLKYRLYALADPRAAVMFTPGKTDSIDLALLVLQKYFPLQISGYDDFLSAHREFLLVSDGGEFDWLTARLLHDGHALRLVSARATVVYEVTVNARFLSRP